MAKSATAGTNIPDGKVLLGFVERVENLQADLATERSESMTRCKVIHGSIKEVFSEAKKTAGLNKKALKKVLEQRSLEAKIEDLRSDEDTEVVDLFDSYTAAIEKVAA